MPPVRHISLEFDPYIPWNRGILKGIEAFAREVPEWRLLRHRMIPGPRIWLKDAAQVIDGLLSTGEKDWAKKMGIPLVRFGSQDPEAEFPVVEVDWVKIGQLAARHLIGKGYRTLALIERKDSNLPEKLRERGFCEEAAKAGIAATRLPTEVKALHELLNSQPAAQSMIRMIEALEKPAGLFARNLQEIYILHSIISEGGFGIPDEVGLMVGGNDREMLDALQPPVTSVSRNSYQIGYTAAATLKRLLDGETVEPLTVIPPGGIIDRGSTNLQAIGDEVVKRARLLIRQRISDPFNVDALARELGVSGRSLRRRFQAALRHSPVREVQLARMEQAKSLLSNSRVSILEIAQRCGFAESCQLSTFFKAETGMTPTEFRGRLVRTER